MKHKIWLSSPHMGFEELERVKEAFSQNWIAPLGPHVDGFEKDLTEKTGAAHAAALSSGTAAIHLALILLDVGPGDEVVCQSMTFSASANPIAYLGAQPVFVDSEIESWNMDPLALRECLADRKTKGKKVKAVIPVHLYGLPAKMDELRMVCEEFEVPIIEDAAEALGATYKGQACGSFGRFGILSFNGNKIITTSGGGALISNDAVAIARARYLATQARDPAPHYQHSTIGYNYRMSNVLAGIGRGQMKVLDDRVAQRRANHERYRTFFRSWNSDGYDIRFQEESEGSYSNRWLTTILVDPQSNHGLTRETIRLALDAENIESRPLWKPMHLQPVFQSAPFYGDGIAERLFEQGLCLPSGSNLTDSDFDRIFEALDRLRTKDF